MNIKIIDRNDNVHIENEVIDGKIVSKVYIDYDKWKLEKTWYEFLEYKWSLGLEINGYHSPEQAQKIALEKYPQFKEVLEKEWKDSKSKAWKEMIMKI